jgi:acetyl esterase/lipase
MNFRHFSFLVLVLVIGRGAAAVEPSEVIKLWPGDPPGAKREIGAEQDLTKPEDRLIAGKPIIKLGNVTTPELHVFLPPEDKRNGTSVVILPGGGYHILAWDLEGTEVAEWLNSIGVAAMVLKYRVPRRAENPAEMAVQDAQRALSLVRSKAKDWGLASDRVGVLGFSAGGNAASLVAVNNAERIYDAVDAVDEIAFRPDFGVIIYGAWMADDKTGELKPEFKVTKETPPIFFAHAADDHVKCEGSIAMFLALKNLGIPSELHIYDAGGHGYGLRHDEQFPVTTWPARCAEWFARHGWLKPNSQ